MGHTTGYYGLNGTVEVAYLHVKRTLWGARYRSYRFLEEMIVGSSRGRFEEMIVGSSRAGLAGAPNKAVLTT
jgi:hypothetical protein